MTSHPISGIARVSALLSALAAPAVAQDFLHFKFDSGCGDQVINYAAGSPAPAAGTIVSTVPGAPAASWVPGKFGAALKGGTVNPALENWVDTGWSPGTVTGDMTWACWLKMDPTAATPSLTYLFGTGSNFRVFTGGGGFLLTAGWGGSNVNTTTHVQNLARAGWTHVALVLDSTALTGTYYIDGVPEAPVTMSAAVNWSGTAFYVGKHSSASSPSIFDMDEFLLVNRALSSTDILALASYPRGADARYGSGGCGALRLSSTGGAPSIGNASYALVLDSAYPAGFFMNVGTNRCRIGALALPFDLGLVLPQAAGCMIEAANDLGSITGGKPAGPLTIGLPIPSSIALMGANLFLQAPALDGSSGNYVVSNALSIGLGF